VTKVIFLTRRFAPEPVPGLALARWLADHGYAVKVMTSFPNYPTGAIYPGYRMRAWQWDKVDGIAALRLPVYPSHDRSALRRTLTYASFALAASTIGVARIGAGDVVYLPQLPVTDGMAGILLGALRRAPIVAHVADLWPDAVVDSGMIRSRGLNAAANTLLTTAFRALYRSTAALTVPSHGLKRRLVERGVPEHKISVVYDSADEAIFAPVPRDPQIGTELGLNDRFNVAYAGNLGPFQGIHTIVDAAAHFAGRPEIQFSIFGTGTEAAALRQRAHQAGLSNLRFFGPQPYARMPQIHAWADVMVIHLGGQPGVRDAIPSKTGVAMSCGRPIVIGSAGEAGELVREAGAGLVCRPEDPADMARAIDELHGMARERRDAMGAAGRAFYERRLSLAVAGRQLDEIFRRLTAGPAE
jgi:glycosyltransferase involved in cell wall biosynthesis